MSYRFKSGDDYLMSLTVDGYGVSTQSSFRKEDALTVEGKEVAQVLLAIAQEDEDSYRLVRVRDVPVEV